MCASFSFFFSYYWSVIIYIFLFFVYKLKSLGATSYTLCVLSGILISIVSNYALLMLKYIYTFILYLYIMYKILYYIFEMKPNKIEIELKSSWTEKHPPV